MKKSEECIIFFSSLEWNTQRQVVHEYCEYLSNDKKILFVENIGVRSLKAKDSLRLARAIKNFFKLKNLFYEIDENITVFRPIFIPFFQYSRIIVFINSIIINFFIFNWIKLKNINSYGCVSFLPTPVIQRLIKILKPSKLIYYCIDNLAVKSSNYKIFKKYENIFIRLADITICTSKILENNAKKISKKVLYVPSGVNYKKLNENNDNLNISDNLFFENLHGKIFGYVGAIRDIIDYEFIFNLSKKVKNSNFVFVGPLISKPPAYIKELNNIYFIGPKSHDLIASYIKKFNFCLIPYLKNDFTDAIYPTKINEYLSLGKPIISTRTYEVEKFSKENSNIINFINFDENLNQVTDKILEVNKNTAVLSKEIAKKNDWSKRFEKIKSIEDNFLEIKKSDDWKLFFNEKINKKIIKPIQIFLLLITFIFLFNSNFFKFYLANNLIEKSENEYANTLVIFSGYGNLNYHNFEYRKRIKDAEEILNKFDIKNILIYGRSNILNENKIIKSFLMQKGYNLKIILIEDKLKNTKENIYFTLDKLENLDTQSVLFISSPILYKRINLLWNKKEKNIKIFFPKTPSTHKILNKKNVDEIKLTSILYEYAAILYNYFRGWI